ncbi:MAG: hypothetical protein K6T66_13840 [Peptococcaceae bacterium]|nr:hypothetical protein [Peptococcaceae bacterium]
MKKQKKSRGFSENEKALVEYFKEKLKQRGVLKFPRDWHLKQLTVARDMLAGPDAPDLEEWKGCINWLFAHKYWGDKTDHLYRVASLWPQYILQSKKRIEENGGKRRELIKRLYL